jgi:hypothetical protein
MVVSRRKMRRKECNCKALFFVFFFGRGVTGAVAKARRFEVVTARRLFLRPKGEIVRFPKYQMDPA